MSKPEYEEPLFKEFELDKPTLNKTIAEHMYRSGFFESGEAFSEEAQIRLENDGENVLTEEFKARFRLLNKIVTEIRDVKEVSSALEWVREHAQELRGIGSDLVVSLHLAELSHILSV